MNVSSLQSSYTDFARAGHERFGTTVARLIKSTLMNSKSDDESITRWFVRLRDGDERAAEILWQHYFPKLIAVAKHRFGADRDPVYGADDAVASVFHLLWNGARQGRYADVGGRDELWRILVTATRRKIIDRVRRENATKRGGAKLEQPVKELSSPEATPEMLCLMDERLNELLGALRNDDLRRIALWRLEGYSNVEIARELDLSERTIERKLRLIREDWGNLIA